MQATVMTFDPDSSQGTVVTDDGRTMDFGAAAFSRGGLRLLRPGQRVRVELSGDGTIEAVTVHTVPNTGHRAG